MLAMDDDAAIAVRILATHEGMSPGDAVSDLIRRSVAAGVSGANDLRGQIAVARVDLLSARDAVITPQHVREWMEREER